MAMKWHPLAELIEQVKQEQGWSDEDLATRARRAGHRISKQHISKLRLTDPLPSLVPQTLRALADALDQPLSRVIEAALPSAGLPAPGQPADWSIEAAIAADPELPVAAKRMLLSLLEQARGEPTRRSNIRPLGQPRPQGKAARRGLEK